MKVLFYLLLALISNSLSGQLQWINPDDNLPSDITLMLNQIECQSEYNYPNCMWSMDPSDTNAQTWPFPLVEGVHYDDLNGTAVFTSSDVPCPIIPSNGDIIVTYTLDNGISTLIHEFIIEVTCASCNGGNGIFCEFCDSARPDGCFTCNVNDLLDGFSSCNPPYQGMIQGPPQPASLCNGQGVPNNMSWFAFVAGSSTINVDVCPSECIPSGGATGIQAGIYDDCDGDCIAGDGGCPNTLRCISFGLNDLTVGKTYYLFVDGCNGAECQYDITISGQDAYILDDMVEVVAETDCESPVPDRFCPGQTIRFNVNHDGATGNFGPPDGPYDPEADLCFEWSFSPELDGATNEIYSQLEDGFVTPDFTLPTVTEETTITVCIEDVFGPCEDQCDDADCVGDCCLDIVIAPLPDEVCVIDVLISELESPAGYDPSAVFNNICGGGIAGWLGATNITLQDIESVDTLVYAVVDPNCNCAYQQKLVINPVVISNAADCQGQNPAENTVFLDWYSNQSAFILNNSTSSCGGVLAISDDYIQSNWIRNGQCSFEIDIEWTVTDDCGSAPQITTEKYTITDMTPPETDVENSTILITCLSDFGGTPPPLDVTDNCEGNLLIDPTVDDSGLICETDGVVIYIYNIEDGCGNIAANSPVTITVNIDNSGTELQWLDPDDNLPGDIEIILNEVECGTEYNFPDCLWSDDPSDPNAKTYPFPLEEGVHFNAPCGGSVFTTTETPCPILPLNGDKIVTYTVDDGCGSPLVHSFTIKFTCAICDGGNGIFCEFCDSARPDGCFTCNVNDLLDGFSSCTPPYQGMVQGPPQPASLCNGQGVPNNMSWFAFVAGSSTMDIDVCPSECIPSGGSVGIQAGIYDDCNGICIAGDGGCPNTLRCISFGLSDLIVGKTYYLFVDGCNGAECQYDITISGQDAYILDDIVEVVAETDCESPVPDRFCPGQTIRFNVNHDGATGNFGPHNGPYDPEADLCFEWSFSPELDGATNEIYNQLEDGFVTPDFTLPTVTGETTITVCIEDVFGPCEDQCDDADCVGDCCLDIVIAPLPDEVCIIDVLISELESPAGYDPTDAYEDKCGGGIAGWLGATNITLQDVESADTLVYAVVDPNCNCAYQQKLVINPVVISSVSYDEKSSIEIFPNPASDIIRIKGLDTNGYNYTIVNPKGRLMQLGIITDNQIKVSDLNAGLCIIEISSQKSKDKYQAKVLVVR